MASPPPSIASLIAGQTDSNMGPGSDEDQAALLTYLKAQYADTATSAGDLSALPTTTYRQEPTPQPENLNAGPSSHDYMHYTMRAPSPPDTSIPIPPSLAELAERANATLNLPPLTSEYEQSQAIAQAEDRGEMGGKRRKQPHERAGWKEMDQDPKPKKRRGGRRNNSGGEEGQNTGYNDLAQAHAQGQMGEMAYLTTQNPPQGSDHGQGQGMNHGHGHGNVEGSTSLGAAVGENNGDVKQQGAEGGQGQSEPLDPSLDPNSKESRAAQNRRAQQVFRRKREEHMKKLEADSAALLTVRHHLSLAEAKLREVALNLESEHIEKLALQVALRNLSQLGVSILNDDASLITQIGVQPRQGGQTDTTTEVEQAFRTLEAQSRELAKVKRNKRGQ